MLKSSSYYKPEKLLSPIYGFTGRWWGRRGELEGGFFQSSSVFEAHADDVSTSLCCTPADGFHEERAVLLGRIGRHQEALEIFANVLKDYGAAEEYCSRHYSADDENASKVYMHLLSIYLRPANESAPQIHQALEVLRKYHEVCEFGQARPIAGPGAEHEANP